MTPTAEMREGGTPTTQNEERFAGHPAWPFLSLRDRPWVRVPGAPFGSWRCRRVRSGPTSWAGMPRTLGCAPRRVGAGGSIVGAVRTVGGLGVSPVLDAPSVMLTRPATAHGSTRYSTTWCTQALLSTTCARRAPYGPDRPPVARRRLPGDRERPLSLLGRSSLHQRRCDPGVRFCAITSIAGVRR